MNSHDAAKLIDGLRALARESAGVEAPASIETALRTEFGRRQSMKKWRRVVIASGIAASIVMLVASAMIRTRREPLVVEVRQPVPAPAVPPQLPPPVVRPVPPAAQAVRVRASREVVTDFFPVVGTDPHDLLRGGSMMRVRLPRSAMINFGLPVHPDRYGESVAADVLLGEDGLARAIRFVR
jgi:hypothetical protein